ncbi:phosphoserine transaminase [Bifidobacterium choloepi]|uniref:Phosphoserine aminotransferase n=1 Tax=Bifidobacterium choloepi TaxID=2614131 RepID=A0A6I5MZ66_9BIFI|nr:phosphoserine transaminase [Bifidobacterium choloepi]NEG69577.1 phosphoserine transaminase [Bifidobacterium choloepi]
MATIEIPQQLLPGDGRFGAGPSKIRAAQVEALAEAGATLLGTSHRQAPVKDLVGSIREGLANFFHIPDDYEVVLGNGGASAFWDIACANLIEKTAAVGTYGSFSKKMAASVESAPFLDDPLVFAGEPGTYRIPDFDERVDAYCWAQNETSTGVAAPVRRVPGSQEAGALTIIDATSAAGALPVDVAQADAYYFSPQKAFGAEGGLWIAVLSPAAIERSAKVNAAAKQDDSIRWIPPFLSLESAISNSRKNQTLNTPALCTLILLENQVRWLNEQGGLAWSSARCRESASIVYEWAEASDYCTPFVTDPAARSTSVVTVDLDDDIRDSDVTSALRANGIVDVNGYRKLGRNQLRVGVFPSVDPDDVRALTRCIDYVVERL